MGVGTGGPGISTKPETSQLQRLLRCGTNRNAATLRDTSGRVEEILTGGGGAATEDPGTAMPSTPQLTPSCADLTNNQAQHRKQEVE